MVEETKEEITSEKKDWKKGRKGGREEEREEEINNENLSRQIEFLKTRAFSYSVLYLQPFPQSNNNKNNSTNYKKTPKLFSGHYYWPIFYFIVYSIYRNFFNWVILLNRFFQTNTMRPQAAKPHAPVHISYECQKQNFFPVSFLNTFFGSELENVCQIRSYH